MDVPIHSGYADYEWATALNRACLKLFGVWPENDEIMLNVRVIIIIIIMILSSAVPGLHSLFRLKGNIMSIIDNLQYSLPLLISILKLFTMWRKKKELVPILKMIKDDWIQTKTQEERDVMIRRAKTARLIMILGYFIMLFSFLLIVFLPCFGFSLRYLTNLTDPGRLMPMQSYYIYDADKSPLYEITFVLQSITLMTAAAVYTGTDNFWGLVVFHICGQLENLRTHIINLDMFKDFETALSSSVLDHMRLIKSINVIDDVFSSMLFGLLIYFSIIFAFHGFLFGTIIVQNHNLSIMHITFVSTVSINIFAHMCLYCAVGEMLGTQCDGIYEAAYTYKWYRLEPKEARKLLIIMIRANKRLHLTAGKLFPMTMTMFCNLLKTSSGYVSVLLAQQSRE